MSTSSSDLSGREIRFVADTESSETMAWLLNFDKIITKGMGGTLSEQSNLSGIEQVLDIACGPGGWALEVARQHPEIEVTGFDISESMIRFAKALAMSRGYGNVRFLVMDVTQPLQFEDASFDLVNARTLFGVLAPRDWPRLLTECKRILRPGGIIRLTELEAPVTSSPALNAIWEMTSKAFFVTGRSFSRDGRYLGITPALKPLLREAGFEHIDHLGYVLDISSATEDAEGYRVNFRYVCNLVKPFFIKSGLTTEEEFEPLYNQMLAEMLADDFSGLWTYVTAWGEKPAEAQA
jgi:ubiquinone/menaquinone biosynthesis C-methylase UbiE